MLPDLAELDEAWASLDAPTTLAATVVLIADGHPDARGGLDGVELLVVTAVVPQPVTHVRARGRIWRGRVFGEQRDFDLPGTGLDDCNRLQRAPLWAWSAEGQLWWMFEDADAVLDSAAQRARIREQAAWEVEHQRWLDERRAVFTGEAFVNPYNFVSLRNGPPRSKPLGHLGLGVGGDGAMRVSGRLFVDYEAVTPLALSGAGEGSTGDPFRPAWSGGDWIMPGSSLAGSVRAFHEALTDSCLRVIDTDYLPIHRDPASPQAGGQWRMAVVVAPGDQDGEPAAVQLCEAVTADGVSGSAVWVEARDLTGGPWSATDVFHFDSAACQMSYEARTGRVERHGGAVPQRCDEEDCTQSHWRTIVSSALPGRDLQPRGNAHPYHLPFARTSTQTLQLSAPVLDTYAAAARDAADVVKRRRGGDPSLTVTGVGARQEVLERLQDGQVVWVQLKAPPHGAASVVRVTPSVLWRSKGAHAVSERIDGYGPCTGPTAEQRAQGEDPDSQLCPSCRLFGMVEEREDADAEGTARMSAYRGHVRFSHSTISALDESATHLREMGSPRPSAGQFYLTNTTGGQAAKGERPLREWGSTSDSPRPRLIRGRKFYWAGTSGNDRHVADGGNPEMTSHHRLCPPGTELQFQVWFDNVSPAQLGGLLVSLNPDLLRHPRLRDALAALRESHLGRALLEWEAGLGLHLGRGKGLGLGTVRASLQSSTSTPGGDLTIEAWGAARYLDPDGPAEHLDALACVEAFLATIDPAHLGELVALSAIGWVPSATVMYPPDDHPGGDFQFDFWRRTTGAASSVLGYQPGLVSLPRADADDVTVPRPWLGAG